MERKKKSTCSCFAFLRRKRSKDLIKSSAPSLHPSANEAGEMMVPRTSVNESLQERSLGTSQKIVPVHSFRSCIVTPNRRNPQLHKLFPAIFSNCQKSKPDLMNSIETSLSRPTTIREPPNIPAVLPAEKLEKSFLRKIEEARVKNKEEIKAAERMNEKDCSKPVQFVRKNNFKVFEGFFAGPDVNSSFLSSSSRFCSSPVLESLDVSPIKCVLAAEDYSDILNLLSNPDKIKAIPDVFVRNVQKPKQLPVLKPTTPYYFAKKRVLPSLRIDNQSYINKIAV